MAITAATTLTTNFSGALQPERSAAIFERAREGSVVQRLATQVPLGASGQDIPYVSTRPSAGWVSEGGQKPATSGAMALRSMSPKKLAAVLVVSAEVVRANPYGFMEVMQDEVGQAFATAFDAAALHGTSSPFAADIDDTAKTVEIGTTAASAGGAYGDLVAAMKLLTDDDKRLTGWALDYRIEPLLLASVDTAGRPLFVDTPLTETVGAVRPGRLLGRPAYIGDGIYSGATTDIEGYGGDWSQVAWGVVGGISYKVSTEASVTINGALTSLFENNLVAVLAEAEYGFVINDTAAFVKLTNAS